MKLIKNRQVIQLNPSQLIKENVFKVLEVYLSLLNPVENFSFCSLNYEKISNIDVRLGLNTHTLKLTIETPEQHQLCYSCGFILNFEQILILGFHAYLRYFTNSCFHCFEQENTIWERFQKR